MVDSAVKKLEQRSLLKTDLKDVIDTVSDLFEELPTNNPLIESNKSIIEAYLNSDLELHSSIDSMLRTSIIPAMSLPYKKVKISSKLRDTISSLSLCLTTSGFLFKKIRGILQDILDQRKNFTSAP